VVNQPEVKKNDGEKKPGDKDAKNKIFLPPSFMEATLLSGINAPTLEAAKSQPRPVFLRVKDLAILPNSIKTNLKGCFVIAEGNGDLSDERVHLRLITLSCLAKDGRAVVNAPVKGFVIDSDGVIGLKGNVVTKMGALLGRSIMAGFFGGVGDAVKASTQTTSISPLGTTQTLDPNQVLAAGIGAGVSSGFQKLQDFYLDMARQTFPVVEVGATKTVTLVFSEGVELSINKYCISGIEECQEEEDDTKQS
jgi:conjugal transfer pilus assembly protein TraB